MNPAYMPGVKAASNNGDSPGEDNPAAAQNCRGTTAMPQARKPLRKELRFDSSSLRNRARVLFFVIAVCFRYNLSHRQIDSVFVGRRVA